MSDAYLTINYALFLFGIGVICGHSAQNIKALKTWTLSILGLELWLIIEMLLTYDLRVGGIQFVTDMSWIHTDYWLGCDGFSLLFLLIVYLLLIVCLLFSWQKIENTKSYTLTLLLIACFTTLLVGAHHLILQVVFLGLLLTSVYFHLLTQGSHRQNLIRAFGRVALSGYCCIFIGVIIIFFHGTVMTHNLLGLNQALTLPYSLQLLIALLLLIGSAYFIPLFPFHKWLFLRFEETSFSEKVILLGILGKVIFVMLVRIIVVILPATSSVLIPVLVVWGLIDLIYAALGCMAQKELNNCAGYWALSLSGLLPIILATLLGTSLPQTSGSGGLLLLVTMMLSLPVLFVMHSTEASVTDEQNSSLTTSSKSQPFIPTLLFFFSLGLPGSPLFIALIVYTTDLTVLPAWQIITVLIIAGLLIGAVAMGKHWLRLVPEPKLFGSIPYTYRTALIIIISSLLIGAVFPSVNLKILENNVVQTFQPNTPSQKLQ